MKKTLSAVLSMVLAFGLAACGSDTGAGAQAVPAAEEVTETAQEAAETVTEAVEEAVQEAEIEITPEEIDSLLQGTWKLSDNTGEMAFDNGSLVISGNGQMMDGSYEISTEESAVKGEFVVEDKTLVITIPYTYEDGVLKIFNNRNVELIKQ